MADNELNVAEQKPNADPEMIFVQGGTFKMGGDRFRDELPIHNVTLDSYYLGKFQVTQGDWEAIMGNNPSWFKKGDIYPVEQVSWDDVQEFLIKFNQITGKKYRLPTEAEWEFAAQGGNLGGGINFKAGAWHMGNSKNTTHPVGLLSPNRLGLYDICGNIMEWCSDWYDIEYYHHSPEKNPPGPASGEYRTVRGGSWYSPKIDCRYCTRLAVSPIRRSCYFGFRLAHPAQTEV